MRLISIQAPAKICKPVDAPRAPITSEYVLKEALRQSGTGAAAIYPAESVSFFQTQAFVQNGVRHVHDCVFDACLEHQALAEGKTRERH